MLLPGGFGTMDEAFELLTLVQTGKSHPAPVVLLEVPGGTYWASWKRFVEDELMVRRLISPNDLDLVHITDDVDDAVREIEGFYSNYHSIRFVDRALVIRLRGLPSDEELERLNEDFADIVTTGRIEPAQASPAEIADRDHVELARLRLRFDRTHWARLRKLIDAVNHPSSTDGTSRPAPVVSDQPDTVSGDAGPNAPGVDPFTAPHDASETCKSGGLQAHTPTLCDQGGVVTFHRLGNSRSRVMLQLGFEPEGGETGAWRGEVHQDPTL